MDGKIASEILQKLDQILQMQKSQYDEEIKNLKKQLQELHDFRVRYEARENTKSTMMTTVSRHWVSLMSLVFVLVLGALELKKMKP